MTTTEPITEKYVARNMLPLLSPQATWQVSDKFDNYGRYREVVETLLDVHKNANDAMATDITIDQWASARAVWEGFRVNGDYKELDQQIHRYADAMEIPIDPAVNVSEDAKRRIAQEEPREKQYPIKLIHGSEIKHNIRPLEWLIPSFLPKNKLVQNFGMGGSGKSTINLDIALTLAQYINVVYCAGEDESEYVGRTSAWTEYHKRGFGGFHFYPAPFNLMKPDEVQDFLEQITPIKPQLIILDPLVNFMVGYSDSEQKDMNLIVDCLNKMRRELNGATIFVCHHTGWSETHERGSSVLRAACRMVMKTTNNDGRIVLTCEKANGFKKFDPRYFDAQQVNDDIVLIPGTRTTDTNKVSQTQIAILQALTLEQYNHDGATFMQILEEVETKKSSLNAAISKLLKLDAIVKDSDKRRGAQYVMTEIGRRILQRADEGRNPMYGHVLPDAERGFNWSVDASNMDTDMGLVDTFRPVEGYELTSELHHELDSELRSELTQDVNYAELPTEQDADLTASAELGSTVVQASQSLVHDSSHVVHGSSELPSSSSFVTVSLRDGTTELVNNGKPELDWTLLRAEFAKQNYGPIVTHCQLRGVDSDGILDMLLAEHTTSAGQ